MRVLVVTHSFPTPYDPIRGTFVQEQVKALRRLGVDIVVCAYQPFIPVGLARTERGKKFAATPEQVDVDGIPVHYPRVFMLPRGRLFAFYGLIHYAQSRHLVRRLAAGTPFDLVHAHTVTPDGVLGVLLGRKLNIPTVCTLHGGDIYDYPHRSRITRLATVWALERTNVLVAVSAELRERVALLSANVQVTVVPNGADPQMFRQVPKLAARSRLGLPVDASIVLFVGYLVIEKGLQYLLDAVMQLDNAHAALYLVGDGPLHDTLLSHDACSRRAVHFVGRRPHEEIPTWLSAADCLVLPSISEGLPTILAEAMVCGVPIIATSVGGVPEVIRDRYTGLLVPCKDASALARAIEELLADKALRAILSDQAKSFATEHLTRAANANNTLAIYQRLTGTTAKPRPVPSAA